MLAYMMQAEVGDDVFGEDPTVNRLEAYVAELFGMEAALFCISATMANQMAIKLNTQPADEMICATGAHIYYYEAGGAAFNSGVSVKYLDGDRGRINAAQVQAHINPDDPHFPKTSMVSIENACNRGGGSCYSIEAMQEMSRMARENELRIHLDGARIFNALTAIGHEPIALKGLFDTITICCTKGLGAPGGSLLIGTSKDIYKARRIRKVLGGGMRQAGYLAAACLYGLEHNRKKLETDHRHAKQIAESLETCDFVENIMPVETNFVIFHLKPDLQSDRFLDTIKKHDILALCVGPQRIRLVTHLDTDDRMIAKTCEVLRSISF